MGQRNGAAKAAELATATVRRRRNRRFALASVGVVRPSTQCGSVAGEQRA
jgi:hypothetical protein